MRNLRSDASLKRVIGLDLESVSEDDRDLKVYISGPIGDPTIDICFDDEVIAEINIRDVISKRASLRGIEKRMRASLRAGKKKK